MNVKALATDLDGTLIPLDDHPQNRTDLKIVESMLADCELSLVFVTGRHFNSVEQAIQQHALPQPDWIICDVGTTIMQHMEHGAYGIAESYATHLAERVAECPASEITQVFAEHAALRLQEVEKQGRFKVSFYTDASCLPQTTTQLREQLKAHQSPWSIISSVDPFNGDGLIDLLPIGVSKAYAIDWWRAAHNLGAEQLIFAGDSGNDIAALTAGYCAIVVGNAAISVVQETQRSHANADWTDRLFLSTQPATSGVVDGLRHFLDSATTQIDHG